MAGASERREGQQEKRSKRRGRSDNAEVSGSSVYFGSHFVFWGAAGGL